MDHDDDEIARELRRIEQCAAQRRCRERVVAQYGRDELRRRVRVQVGIYRRRKHMSED